MIGAFAVAFHGFPRYTADLDLLIRPTVENADRVLRAHLPPGVRTKAAGGVRTLDALLEVRSMGIARAGATQTAKMLQECKPRMGLPLETEPGPEPVGRI